MPTQLPGGFEVGQEVFYTSSLVTFKSGNKVAYGLRGQVSGLAEKEGNIEVQFEGNPAPVDVPIGKLSSTKPPEPPQEAEAMLPRQPPEDPCRIISLTEFKGRLQFPDKFKPDADCAQSALHAGVCMPEVKQLAYIIPQCEAVAADRLDKLPVGATRLSHDQALALALYSFELGMMSLADGKDNFFVVLNEKLRGRQQQFMLKIRGYLFFLLSAMETLPAFECTVFRGVPASARGMVAEKYKKTKKIFWSSFTSTSTDISVAMQFAEGAGGVVFRIFTSQGRNIKDYSAEQQESEILLSPSSEFIVTEGLQLGDDGMYYVDMMHAEGRFVF